MPGHRLLALAVLLFLTASGCSLRESRGPVGGSESPQTAPARQPEDAIFSALRARDVDVPELPPGAQCPGSAAVSLADTGIPAEAALRPLRPVQDFPLYVVLPVIPRALDLFPPADDGWRRATILLLSKPGYRGPVLVRGRQLDGPHPVRFEVARRAEEELRLPAGRWDERKAPLLVWGRTVDPDPGWRVAAADVLMRAGGCYGLQVDARSFSYTIPFHAIWQS